MQKAERDKKGLHIAGCLGIGIVDASQGERGIRSEVVVKAVDDKPISPGRPAVIEYIFQKYYIGRYNGKIELLFEDTKSKAKFVIHRRADAVIGNKHDHETLKPRAPYMSLVRAGREPGTHVLPFPSHLRHIGSRQTPASEAPQIQKFRPGKFKINTYTAHFKSLLWYEKQKTESDLAWYDMLRVPLSRYNSCYYLTIPGLAEKRLSVPRSPSDIPHKLRDYTESST
ncbi:hypothetical protein BKA70DRAFT_1474333 [Coprinopsis sp. MPI-PUGE-AT-0042]|nr:hypothetical protein BKA70DRAFT_1474333 [Coprinopsis sp. MPI-PUGE-AT-0042]